MSAPEPTTEQLVAGAQAGDTVAREALFARYAPRVSRMVAARLGVRRSLLPAAAEDVVQDALLRAFAGFDRFEMRSRGAFAAWMATIVLNCVRRHHRDRRGNGERAFWQRYGDLDLHDTILCGGEPSPSRVAQAIESNDRVEAAMLSLPALYREVLSLRGLLQLSHAEIAQRLGRTEVSCRKLAQRATEMLHAQLARASP